MKQAEAGQVRVPQMRSSGITLIAEERAAQHRRARVRALGLIIAAAVSLVAIFAVQSPIDAELITTSLVRSY